MTITLQAVNELIASLESAGELSIREQKFLKLAKEFRICSALVIWLVFFVDAMRCLISFNEAPNVAHLSYALSIFSKASLAESPLLFAAANISENSVIAASNASVSGKSFVVRIVSNKSACLPSK